MDLEEEFEKRYQPKKPSTTSYLTAPLPEFEAAVDLIWSYGEHTGIPVLLTEQRRGMAARLPRNQRRRAELLRDILIRRPEFQSASEIGAASFTRALSGESAAGLLVRTARTIRARTELGRRVCNVALLMLNTGVERFIEKAAADPALIPQDRVRIKTLLSEAERRREQEADKVLRRGQRRSLTWRKAQDKLTQIRANVALMKAVRDMLGAQAGQLF